MAKRVSMRELLVVAANAWPEEVDQYKPPSRKTLSAQVAAKVEINRKRKQKEEKKS